MDISKKFINYIKFDDQKRILVSIKPEYESYLQDQKIRQMLKNAAGDVLKDEFKRFEIGKNICRITVKEGTEETNIERVKSELFKGLGMAMKFMSQMGK